MFQKELIDKLIFFSQSLIFKSVSLYSRPSQQKSWGRCMQSHLDGPQRRQTSSNNFEQLGVPRDGAEARATSAPGTSGDPLVMPNLKLKISSE